VHFAFSVPHGELGTESRGPVEHDGGDQSLYFEDPDGNVVEAWDFFEDGDGVNEGVAALT
jgi:catechol-2,3-dioxygenase